ncbi:MAG: hypothetical protein Q8P46_07810 [Hyphomicrobiales bacterium]|nr:hypothetical protein [Hyphomicrobiales bacterium]
MFYAAVSEESKRHIVCYIDYLSAFLIVASAAYFAISEYPGTVYLPRDGRFSLWLVLAHIDWSTPFQSTTLNPFQGMGSMLIPVNPWFHPPAWLFLLDLPLHAQIVWSGMLYWGEVFLSALLLARALGLAAPRAFFAALVTSWIVFPPFNFVFGLPGIVASSAFQAQTLAVGNAMLSLFVRLGPKPARSPWPYGGASRNLLLIFGILACLALLFLAAPFWNAGFLIGDLVFFAIVFLTSADLQTVVWRIMAGLASLAVAFIVDLPGFLLSFMKRSARFAGGAETGLFDYLAIDFTTPVGPDVLDRLLHSFKAWGLLVPRSHAIGLTGSTWIQIALIAGAATMALCATGLMRRLAISFGVIWTGLLCYWSLVILGFMKAPPFAPQYFYLPLLPLWAIVLLSLVGRPLLIARRLAARTGLKSWLHGVAGTAPAGNPPRLGFLSVLAVYFALTMTHFDLWPTLTRNLSGGDGASHRIWPYAAPMRTEFISILEREISLRPGDRFRGSLAVVAGTPGGQIRKMLGVGDDEPAPPSYYDSVEGVVRAHHGNSLLFDDRWLFRIPGLVEYGQAIDRALMAVATELLAPAFESREAHFARVKALNVDLLRAMGVRFVVTDLPRESHAETVSATFVSPQGLRLDLLELNQPNLGDFSPTDVEIVDDADAILGEMRKDAAGLARRAFVQVKDLPPLSRAGDAEFRFIRGGAAIRAKSAGTAALLLPLRYSKCLKIRDHLEQNGALRRPRLVRANLIHSLLVFDRRADLSIMWDFGLTGDTKCMAADVEAFDALGL